MYCVKCKKQTDFVKGSLRKELTSNGRFIHKSTCNECGSIKCQFGKGIK